VSAYPGSLLEAAEEVLRAAKTERRDPLREAVAGVLTFYGVGSTPRQGRFLDGGSWWAFVNAANKAGVFRTSESEPPPDLLARLEAARSVLVFADGVVLTQTGFTLADLYAEDYEPAQKALRDAGCHPRSEGP
jgi:hypothetical protein